MPPGPSSLSQTSRLASLNTFRARQKFSPLSGGIVESAATLVTATSKRSNVKGKEKEEEEKNVEERTMFRFRL